MSKVNEKIDKFMEDLDNDGTPDSIQRALKEVKTQLSQKMTIRQKTFTKKNFYVSILIGVIIAGYGLFGYMYMSLRDDKIAIENQFHWMKSEQEIEVNKAVMIERKKLLDFLHVEYDTLDEGLNELQAIVNNHIERIRTDAYLEGIENEINKYDKNELNDSFSRLGFKPTE